MRLDPPAYADVTAARRRIEGYAYPTPVIENAQLNARAGRRVLIKAECLQRTGSFKFRGAWNAISQLDPAETPGGVVAFSSGNHAQGVAAAAQLRGLRALIVMPADTPEIKQANTLRLGAEIVTYDRAREDRMAIARGIAAERRAAIVPPFDHPHVIAGQGTAGLEFVEQATAIGVEIADVLVPASGGGLAAGIALAFAGLSPLSRVWTAEPQDFDDHARSLACGRRERNAAATGSICDALLSREPGEMTFAINRHRLAGGLAVSEAEVRAAVRYAFEVLKLVIEPGGAVALAAVLAGKLGGDTPVGVIASGGNVDAKLFAEIIVSPLP
jgi:threonine dehydratase